MNCVIYTYGGHERGMGHIYQSRAMAGELERLGFQVQFIVPDVPEGVAKLREWGLSLQEIPYQASEQEKIVIIEELLAGKQVSVVVMDILESTPGLMSYLGGRSDLLVSIDDIGEGRVHADLLFNIIHHPKRLSEAKYREINDLNYAILRPQFFQAHEVEKHIPERASKLLISQGGSDTFGGVVELAKALELLPSHVDIHLVLGSAFRHDEDLQSVIDVSKRRFVLERDVQDMAGLMARMDVAITGGGKTLFELAAVGVPIVAVTEEAREVETMDIVARHVLCENMGWRRQVGAERIAETVESLLGNPERRAAMSLSGKKAIDGRGAWRTADTISQTVREKKEVSSGSVF
jgi:UDP-2,4-diacetamido-2,4,6-trideoxy-beta-L-altropyranose hydrolase